MKYDVCIIGAGVTGAMLTLLVNVFIGFSIGANVVVARSIGSGDAEKTVTVKDTLTVKE